MTEAEDIAVGTGETGSSPANPPPPGAPKRRGRRLRSVQNVKAMLGHVLREVEAGRLESVRARVLIYGCSVLLSAIQGADLEARIRALEGRSPR